MKIDAEHAETHIQWYCVEGEMPQKFPYLEVWLSKFSTIHAGIKGRQTIESYHGIIKTCKLNI